MMATTDRSGPGAWASLLCRKRFIDDELTAAARDGLDAVVIAGAGYDTRAYRVPGLADVAVWEVDLTTNIAAKTQALQRCFHHVPPNVTLLAVDLETEDLAEKLAGSGFDTGMRTFFIWESVTMYLSDAVVGKTLQSLAHCAPGSRLVFTYFRKDFADGHEMYGARDAYQRLAIKQGLLKFGMNPDDVAGVLAEYGWRETQQLGPAEYRERYLAPAGRELPVSEVERAVSAERVGPSSPTPGPGRVA